MAITVSLVEDDALLRESISSFIESTPGFRCLSAFATAEEALRCLPKQTPDVVLMDINLPKLSGIQCVARLKAVVPTLQLVMLTVYQDSDRIFEALAAGASGYLLKSEPPEKLLEAVAEVHRGGSPMSSHIARKVVQSFQRLGNSATETENLSPREREILHWIAEGFLDKEIADKLTISVTTVRTHIRHIYEKLHVRTRAEAVAKHWRK